MGTLIKRGWGCKANTIGASANATTIDVSNCTSVNAHSPPETHACPPGTRVRTCAGFLDIMTRTMHGVPKFATALRMTVMNEPMRGLSLDIVADHWQDANGLFAFKKLPAGVPSWMRAVRSPLGFTIQRWFQEPAFEAFMMQEWTWRIARQG